MLSPIGWTCDSGTIGCDNTSVQALEAYVATRKVVSVVLANGVNDLCTFKIPAVPEEVADVS